MNYIKFDTITSTNDFLKSYCKVQDLPDFFYVYADTQTKGRGQRSNNWQSDCCKNILISYYLKPNIDIDQQNLLNKIVAVAIIEVLQKFNISGLKIKLPNDIMADNQKIAGILIENVLAHQKWKQSIIGIGLNVNQMTFDNLPQATSMKKITGQTYDIEQIMADLTQEIKHQYFRNPDEINANFERLLIRPK